MTFPFPFMFLKGWETILLRARVLVETAGNDTFNSSADGRDGT